MHDTEAELASIKRRIATATGSWARATSLAEIRASFDALFAGDEPCDFDTFSIETMRAAWIEPPADASGRTILFCHGGGFQVGSIRSHLGLMRRLAAAAEARVLAFEYRLAPEHKYPTAIEDASAAYRWLLDQGLPASHIAVAGDSAGAAIAIQVALRARDQRLAVPACAALISPWLDLTMRGASYESPRGGGHLLETRTACHNGARLSRPRSKHQGIQRLAGGSGLFGIAAHPGSRR